LAHEVTDALQAVERVLLPALDGNPRRPFLLGLCGAQGSGKSTLAAALHAHLVNAGVGCAILSLDDLYKTKSARAAMARSIHPLFATRGVPGTHELALAFDLLGGLERHEAAALPRFDKSADDRFPEAEWDIASEETRILILEGWCVGARPQAQQALVEPVNSLEREDDPDGTWRRHVNAALAGDYQRLFARIDLLILLAAPEFEVVRGWRAEQEAGLRAGGRGGMNDASIARFVEHYERLTRHILAEMPAYADLTIRLDSARRLVSFSAKSG